MYPSSSRYFFFVIGIFLLLVSCNQNKPAQLVFQKEADFKRFDLRTRMDLAMEQEVARTMDPTLGYVPKNRLVKAFDKAEIKRSAQHSRVRALGAISGVQWKERGPNNLGGRTRAMMFDPNDTSETTLWAAGVSGGLWKTNDITKANPDWTSIDDLFENMAITSLAHDPVRTDTMYFGTGEGYFNLDAVQGNGIWRSTDGGNSWTQLSSTITDNFNTCSGSGDCDFLYVNKIVVTNSGTVLAATRSKFINRGGIMRSTDAGATWTKVLTGLSGTNACSGNNYRQWASDLEIAANGDIYASLGIFDNNGIWKSSDDGATWGSPIYTSACDEQRIELATAPSNANYIYALVQEDDASINKIMRSVDGGSNWSTLSNPSWIDQNCGSPSTDFTRGQAWYDLIAAVDPLDEETVYIGGIDLLRTTNGGSTWTQLTNWAGQCDYPEVHADQHAIIYKPGSSNVMYFGNDGGVYYTENGSATNPTFERKEFGYNTAQFYSIAMDPDAYDPGFLGGTQDNGSNKITNLGISSIVEVTGGDGGFAHIDQDQPNFQITAFTNSNFSRSTDGGLTFDLILGNSGGPFINPTDYADSDNNFYAGFGSGQYLSATDMTTSPSFGVYNVPAFNSAVVSAVSTSPNTSERVFFGLGTGLVIRVNNAVSSPSTLDITGASFPSGSVSCIAIEDGEDDHLLVTYSNYGVVSIWETTNGGTSWTAVEGDLPDMPVRWALFNPNNSDQALIATELGVWSTDNLNGVMTEWEPSNDGLANVRTDMLQIRSSDNLVVAATHGRGVFTSDIFASEHADFASDKNTIYAEAPISFTDASYKATSWLWEFGDGGISTEQNPIHSYKRPGKYDVTLTINGGGDSQTKSQFIHVLPNLGVPFTASDGGNFESNTDYFGSDDLTGGINLWELGVPGNAETTVNSGVNAWKTTLSADIIEADYSCALFTPNFNMSNTGTYTLSFRKSMERQFSNAPFAVQVQYSLDNGINWSRLGTDNDGNGFNWYDKGPNSTTSLETDVVHDRYGFNDNYSNENTTYDISELSGNATVAFRVVLFVAAGYSGGYDRDGFMIDDFEISGPVNEANVNITENSPGSMLSFDGIDDYTNLSDLSINETFTIEMWLSPEKTDDGQTFLAKHDAGGNDIFKVGFDNAGWSVDLRSLNSTGGTKATGLHHLAVSVEKLTLGTSEISTYLDGDLIAQETVSEVLGSSDGLDWVLGQDWDGLTVTSDYYEGSIDELRIWNAARSIDEIRENNFLISDGLDTDLVGYWQFNENTGTNTQNIITSNTGTLIGTSWSSSLAPVSKGTSFSGSISSDGSTTFGNLAINFSEVSDSYDLVVFELNNTPLGLLPDESLTLNETIFEPYYVINQYESGSFSSASLTYTLGSGVFTESNPSNIVLFKRASKSSGSWALAETATSANPSTGQIVFDGITSFSQTTIGTVDSSLPVELTSFHGAWTEELVRLNWKTASEQNSSHFEILRSRDGLSWTKIGRVQSLALQGKSSSDLDYVYHDTKALRQPEQFYRLKQIDFDGKFTFTEAIRVEQKSTSFTSLRIYPNPATHYLFISTNSEVGTLTVELFDLSGQLHRKEQLTFDRESTVHEMDVQSLRRGLYMVKVSSETTSQVEKIYLN